MDEAFFMLGCGGEMPGCMPPPGDAWITAAAAWIRKECLGMCVVGVRGEMGLIVAAAVQSCFLFTHTNVLGAGQKRLVSENCRGERQAVLVCGRRGTEIRRCLSMSVCLSVWCVRCVCVCVCVCVCTGRNSSSSKENSLRSVGFFRNFIAPQQVSCQCIHAQEISNLERTRRKFKK
jgi:hypothetical protein